MSNNGPISSPASSPEGTRPAWSPGFKALLAAAALALALASMFAAWHVSLHETTPQEMLVAGLGGALVVPYLCLYASLIWHSALSDLSDDATMLAWTRRLRAWRLGIVVIWLLVALPVAVPFAASRLPSNRIEAYERTLREHPVDEERRAHDAIYGTGAFDKLAAESGMSAEDYVTYYYAGITASDIQKAVVNSAFLAAELATGIGLIVSLAVGAAGYGVSVPALRHIRGRIPRILPANVKLKPEQVDASLPEKVAHLRKRVGKSARFSFAFTWDEPLDLDGDTSKSRSAKRRRKRQGASTTGNPRADAMAEIAQSASISHLRLAAFCFVAFAALVAAFIVLGIRFGFLE